MIERIERLEEDKAAVMADIKEVYAEVKGEGYDVKALREVVRIRKQDAARLQEHQAIVDLYLHAIQGELFDDGPRVTISVPGSDVEPVVTTVGAMRRATEAAS